MLLLPVLFVVLIFVLKLVLVLLMLLLGISTVSDVGVSRSMMTVRVIVQGRKDG